MLLRCRCKWLKMSGMVEISQSDFRNFSGAGLFQYVVRLEIQDSRMTGEIGSGGEYALREISGVADDVDGSAGVFAGAGSSRSGNRVRWSRSRRSTPLCGGTASMCVRLLFLVSVRVRSVRILRAELLC